jgi:two-component system response regulator FixJ
VSDVNMPGGDGIDLLGIVRGRGVLPPVIVMSGRPSPDGKARALAGGAFRYMIKPVMPSELRLVIESALAPDRGVSPNSPPTTERVAGSRRQS